MLTSVNKSNGKDMLDCFINIYVHTELMDWLRISREFCNSL